MNCSVVRIYRTKLIDPVACCRHVIRRNFQTDLVTYRSARRSCSLVVCSCSRQPPIRAKFVRRVGTSQYSSCRPTALIQSPVPLAYRCSDERSAAYVKYAKQPRSLPRVKRPPLTFVAWLTTHVRPSVHLHCVTALRWLSSFLYLCFRDNDDLIKRWARRWWQWRETADSVFDDNNATNNCTLLASVCSRRRAAS